MTGENDRDPGLTTVLQNASVDRWYDNGLVYAVDVKTFRDSDADGVGDVQGLIERLDYLDHLGVTCLWLLPFYPSPGEDNGYDVVDYYGIDERLGTLGDFVRLVREAHQRGIKVLIDLVVNHTSSEHPWFQQAREDPDSKYRDFYVWREDPPEDSPDPVFPEEESVWTYDETAGAYYYHRFYDFEPGLDHTNPDVREEVKRVMDFWLELGIDGFRVDATPFVAEHKGEAGDPERSHEILKEYRAFMASHHPDAVLLGEAGGDPEEVRPYFGDGAGDEMQLIFNFVLTDYLFAALATEESATIEDGLDQVPLPPENGQWANFLRNLDELNLEWLPEDLRETVLDRFSPDEEMRIFDRGSRRRLAPMMEDRRQLELAYSLLFSMPGTPVVPYGDEIGMGDNLSLDGRDAVRTPMQWADAENAGFSGAPPGDLVRPVIDEGEFAYDRVNVDDQRADPDSLLNWMTRLIGTRREYPSIGRGEVTCLDVDPESVLAHRVEGDRSVVAVHNLAGERRRISLAETGVDPGELVVIFAPGRGETSLEGAAEIDLPAYGYVWFKVGAVSF